MPDQLAPSELDWTPRPGAGPARATARTGELKALTRRQPARTLALALAELNDRAERDEAARLTRAVIIDVILEKSPAAAAVYDALVESDLECEELDSLMIAAALEEEADRD